MYWVCAWTRYKSRTLCRGWKNGLGSVIPAVAVTEMHSLMQAQHAASFKKILENADLVVTDGFPLVWLGRRKGFPLRRRVYGPELMERFCEETAAKGYRHFFYGGAPGVAEHLSARLAARFSGLQTAGVCCPPYRTLTQAEDEEEVSR